MKISRITGFVFSILILDLLFYGIFYDVERHGFIPERFKPEYGNILSMFTTLTIILSILFALALVKDLLLESEWKE